MWEWRCSLGLALLGQELVNLPLINLSVAVLGLGVCCLPVLHSRDTSLESGAGAWAAGVWHGAVVCPALGGRLQTNSKCVSY